MRFLLPSCACLPAPTTSLASSATLPLVSLVLPGPSSTGPSPDRGSFRSSSLHFSPFGPNASRIASRGFVRSLSFRSGFTPPIEPERPGVDPFRSRRITFSLFLLTKRIRSDHMSVRMRRSQGGGEDGSAQTTRTMATRARVVRLPGAQACKRRVPGKAKASVDAMEEPLWEGHAERMRMLLEREAREAMKRQVHRLDKVRARTTEQARPEKKTGEIPERFLRN